MHSHAETTTAKCLGAHPAITALMAHFSTVSTPLLGATFPVIDEGKLRKGKCRNKLRDPRLEESGAAVHGAYASMQARTPDRALVLNAWMRALNCRSNFKYFDWNEELICHSATTHAPRIIVAGCGDPANIASLSIPYKPRMMCPY